MSDIDLDEPAVNPVFGEMADVSVPGGMGGQGPGEAQRVPVGDEPGVDLRRLDPPAPLGYPQCGVVPASETRADAQSLGISELILPVRYAMVKDFTEGNADEAISLVARMQYMDCTKLRLKGSASAEYRTAVNVLATRLAELASTIAERQLSDELKEAGSPETAEPGLADIFDKINRILPDWLESVEASQVASAQFRATWHARPRRVCVMCWRVPDVFYAGPCPRLGFCAPV